MTMYIHGIYVKMIIAKNYLLHIIICYLFNILHRGTFRRQGILAIKWVIAQKKLRNTVLDYFSN